MPASMKAAARCAKERGLSNGLWSRRADLNRGPADYESAALPTELRRPSAGTMEEVAPRKAEYRHHLRWGDDNGSSHVRAALVGPSLTVPFAASALTLGTWQQIMLVELDTRPRKREIVIQIVGE